MAIRSILVPDIHYLANRPMQLFVLAFVRFRNGLFARPSPGGKAPYQQPLVSHNLLSSCPLRNTPHTLSSTMAFVSTTFVVSSRAAPVMAVSSFSGARVMSARRARPAALSMNLDTIKAKIAEEVSKAKEMTEKHGKTSREAALAWDIVEELEAEASHMRANTKTSDPLEKYCEESPEADEVSILASKRFHRS